MKLKKITAYQQVDGPAEHGISRVIIPSGFVGVWIIAVEDSSYSLNISYPFKSSEVEEIINAIKEAE
jgi:hypothetical protein